MDLKLSEEELLIKQSAATFVDKELIAREGAFLKQREPFLPPGAPARRELDAAIKAELIQKARALGLWCLELPEALGGSPMSALMRVL
ncbi:MAG TPA: acyl-CoA dehydrogenase family protein, partial [Acidobacteriota bacterium]|nr:acyl-CoA dehydrogenase family protein [Acidobacteriota bacterium]